MCALLLSGCVIPPTLEEEPPAPNEPPVIVRGDEGNPILPPPGDVALCPDDDLTINIPVRDANLTDTLRMRLFLDTLPEGGTHTADSTSDLIRYVNAGVPPPCANSAGDSRLLEAIISDRGFKEPTGRETPPDSDALTASVAWLLDCLPPEDCGL